ncbi:unnamed protein product [Prorocentrum cordatum]|uniref:Uncharacterized protein n=1 Tax=Prorocentrum cordatum TaxID=2364126 RepID=A0ABN9Y1P2_9DINO|nr:unnamed protein product [Polarella glacialis]
MELCRELVSPRAANSMATGFTSRSTARKTSEHPYTTARKQFRTKTCKQRAQPAGTISWTRAGVYSHQPWEPQRHNNETSERGQLTAARRRQAAIKGRARRMRGSRKRRRRRKRGGGGGSSEVEDQKTRQGGPGLRSPGRATRSGGAQKTRA